VSLVLSAATVALWVRSYRVVDIVSRSAVKGEHFNVGTFIWSQQGSCGLNRGAFTNDQTWIGGDYAEHGWRWATTSTEYRIDTWHGFRFQRIEYPTGVASDADGQRCALLAAAKSAVTTSVPRPTAARSVGWCLRGKSRPYQREIS
jgi:hypothetical protein